MFTLPLKGWYRSVSATQLSIFEIGVYCLNFNETSHLSFVVNLKFIKQFRTSYKKWRHIVTIPFHFESTFSECFNFFKGSCKSDFTKKLSVISYISCKKQSNLLLLLWLGAVIQGQYLLRLRIN